MEVKFIKIKDKEYPFEISFSALMWYENDMGVKFEQEMAEAKGDPKLESVAKIIHYALKSGHLSSGVPFELTFDDTCILLNNHMKEFMEAYTHYLKGDDKTENGIEKKLEPAKEPAK